VLALGGTKFDDQLGADRCPVYARVKKLDVPGVDATPGRFRPRTTGAGTRWWLSESSAAARTVRPHTAARSRRRNANRPIAISTAAIAVRTSSGRR
jgi:hypothetical protein